MKKINFLLSLILSFYFFSFVYANGCCFFPSTGLCSAGVPSDSCSGEWKTSCDLISECQEGCCVLGSSVFYLTRRNCELEARSRGFEVNWQQVSKDKCQEIISSQKFGACVYGEYKDYCKFVEKKSCNGEFYEGKICSDSSLNTSCKKTTKTKCFEDGNIYYVDSCGNRDALVRECKYEEGFICKQKNSNEAYCKDLNCKSVGKKNGESWCVGSGVNSTSYPVGSRFFKQTCIDGEIVTEPCGDFRSEVCVQEGKNAKCVANQGSMCFDANLEEPDPITGKKVDEDACDPERCYIWEPEGVGSNPLLEDLHLEMCLPKVPQGIDFWNFKGKEGFCSVGNYEGSVNFRLGERKIKLTLTRISGIKLHDWRAYSNEEEGFGKIGLISLIQEHWGYGDYQNIFCLEGNPLYRKDSEKLSWSSFRTWLDIYSTGTLFIPTKGLSLINLATIFQYDTDWDISSPTVRVEYGHCGKIAYNSSWPVEPKVFDLLNIRTIAIGDCAGSVNWVGLTGFSENKDDMFSCKKGDGKKECTYSYEAKYWKAPSSGECSKCGADGLPCSEYRCKALGRNCEYKEPKGIDKGVCVSSKDLTPPSINHQQEPQNPIPPFDAVKISLKTNEDSYCKFDFSSQKGSIENMRYETDGKFGREHVFVLYPPGKMIEQEEESAYPLLTKDGKYEIFVRCEDGAGNYNVNPYIINLEVMQTPDQIPPQILEFHPKSNSFVKFNTTEKRIKFKINEPAECRWDLYDVDYEEMSDSFTCDTGVTEETILKGYYCEGTLTNITQTIGDLTEYYIRCKDQPWLEGREDKNYQRNFNKISEIYILRPSLSLNISKVSPLNNTLFIERNNTNLTINLETKDGGERGKAECKFRILFNNISSSWVNFEKTNSSKHQHTLINLQEGEYLFNVKCIDIAENEAFLNFTLDVKRDSSPPSLTRVYNDKGSLIFATDEFSYCKFTNKEDICFNIEKNGISLNKKNMNLFSTSFRKGSPYYIRCEDIFGNYKCYELIKFF